jgi:hypothetical protein
VFAPLEVVERPRLPPGAAAVSVDLCLVCDATGSMGVHLDAAALALKAAARELELHYPGCTLR